MSEAEMYEQEEVAPKKKGLPTWLWFCGSGCLVMVILFVVGIGWVVKEAKKLADPELQWPKLAEVLPFEERPDNIELQMRIPVPFDMFIMQDTNTDVVGILMHLPSEDAENTRKAMLSLEGGLGNMGKRQDLTPFTLDVQGREIPGARFFQNQSQAGDSELEAGYSAVLDLTRDSEVRPVFLQLVKHGTAAISDEDILAFLEDFEVGG